MSDINVNFSGFDKKNVANPEQVNSQGSQSSSAPVPIGKPSDDSIEAKCKKLNITVEQYTQICNKNAQFVNLTLEEQIKYINSINSQPVSTETNEVYTNEASAETTAQTETTLQNKAAVADKDVEVATKTADEHSKFKNANFAERVEIFTEELAKNKFLYGSQPPKSEEDWNALSDKERKELVKSSEKEIEKQIEKFPEISGLVDRRDKKAILEKMYTNLKVANEIGFSLEDFLTLPAEDQDNFLYSHINEMVAQEKEGTSALTSFEKNFYVEKGNLLEATKYYIKNTTGRNSENLCLDDVNSTLASAKTNAVEVKQMYYESKLEEYENMTQEEKNALSEAERASYETMKKELPSIQQFSSSKMGAKYLSEGQIERPQNRTVLDDINESKASGTGDQEKAFIVNLTLNKECKNKEEYAQKMSECVQQALAEGNVSLAYELNRMGMKVAGKQMAKIADLGTIAVQVSDSANLTTEQVRDVVENVEQIKNKDYRVAGASDIQTNSTDEQKTTIAKEHIKSQDKETRLGVTENLRNDAMSAAVQDEVDQIIRESGDDDVREIAILTTNQLDESIQNKSLKRQLEDGNPRLVKAGAQVPSTLKDQIGAGEIVFDATQKLDKADRVEAQKILADDIVNFKKENQLAMHDILMTSKDDEVLAHTSSNIHRYDESVQAEAIKSSYRTGNQKAIDAVNSQIESCSKKAVAEASKEFNIKQSCAETEARTTKSASESYASAVIENNKIINNLAEAAAVKGLSESEKTSYYIEYFMKTTDNGRYNLLSKLSDNQLKDVISKLCKYNSSMIKGLVAQGLGKYVLQTIGKSPDVLYSTINIMFQKGGKDAKYAANYIMTNKTLIHFSDNMIEKAEEILGKDNLKVRAAHSVDEKKDKMNEETLQYTSNPYGFMKGSLQPRLSSLYPNKKEMFYNA